MINQGMEETVGIELKFRPEVLLLNMIEDKEEKRFGKMIFYMLTAAGLLCARYWKIKRDVKIDEWINKLLDTMEPDTIS